jgi:superoxide dismutase, Fe-Mn family
MTFKLPPLPYAEDALEPYLSAKTLQFHHGKHHQTYVDTLNKLVEEHGLEDQTLEQLIQATYRDEAKWLSSTMPPRRGTTISSGRA